MQQAEPNMMMLENCLTPRDVVVMGTNEVDVF
jgi:hypothetical protein